MTYPTLMNTWPITQAVAVAVSSLRNGSAERLAIRMPVKANTPNSPSRPAAPMKPSSSPTMAKMKSLWAFGR